MGYTWGQYLAFLGAVAKKEKNRSVVMHRILLLALRGDSKANNKFTKAAEQD